MTPFIFREERSHVIAFDDLFKTLGSVIKIQLVRSCWSLFNVKYKIIPVVAMCILAVSSSTVYANNLKDNLSSYNQQLDTVNQQATQQAKNQGVAIQQAQALQASAALLHTAVQNDTQAILVHQRTISDIKDKEQVLIEKREQEIKSLGDYVTAEYKKTSSPAMSNIQFLLGANSLENLITRASYLQDIVGAYNKLGAQIESDTKALDENKKAEQSTLNTLEQAVQAKVLMQNSLTTALKKQNQVIASLTADSQKLLASKSSLQRSVDATNNAIATQVMEAKYAQQDRAKQAQQAQSNQANQSSPTQSRSTNITPPVKFNGTASEIINYAEIFLGSPYVWGGTTPYRFDCSGFVQYSFAHFGINLPRVTWDQFNQGTPVSKANLQAGDLVFFSTYQTGPSHVGIYMGNGMMIDDENSGVIITSINSSYYASKFVGGRRVIN